MYECPFCDATFTHVEGLADHLFFEVNHKPLGQKVAAVVCACGCEFNYPNLVAHIREVADMRRHFLEHYLGVGDV